jgi:hypothetical protein
VVLSGRGKAFGKYVSFFQPKILFEASWLVGFAIDLFHGPRRHCVA